MAAGKLDVPVFPEAARRVMNACERDACDARELADILRRDPALSAHFLRLANSPAFSARSAIVSLPQALARLGTVQTRQIALLVSCKAKVFTCTARRDAAQKLRVQAVATALWAQEIARIRRMNVEEAFLCGLLQDVAMPALWQLAADVIQTSGSTSVRESDVDEHLERMHHEVGASIVERWGFPSRVVASIRLHHATPAVIAAAGGGQSLELTVAVVQLAGALAAADQVDRTTIRKHPAASALSLYDDELDDLLAHEDDVRASVEAAK